MTGKTLHFILLTICFVLVSLFSFSSPIDKTKLVELGKEAFRQKMYALDKEAELQEPKSYFFIEDNDETYMAVLNFNHGFIIMAADDASIPVLAYAFDRDFTLETAAPGALLFIEQYKKEIAAIRSLGLEPAEDVQKAWQELNNPQTKNTLEVVVSPLLTSNWNQTKFYNQYSPQDEESPAGYDGRTPNGCVAVAMAQIMYYYRYPEHGTGGQYTNYTDYGAFSVDYDNEVFLYEAMEDVLSGYNNEVAKLIFDCATSVDMSYSPDGSGAYSENVPNAMATYFQYSPNAHHSNKWGHNNSQWRNYLKTDLNAKRPIYYSGYSDDGGHAFVCDGYNSDNYFHFNFGWGGSSDGFYALNNSDTYSSAVGGFSSGQSCIRDIYPANEDYPFFCSEKIITSHTGTLEDGSSNQDYQNNQSCTYVITNDDAYMFTIYIDRFATQQDHDSLSFWDGHPANGNLLKTISGHITSQPYYNFNTDSLYITFMTDDSITDAGWHLSFYTYRDVANCVSDIFHEAQGVITDGSGDALYKDNASCYWSIRVSNAESILITFDDFNISPEDRLSFYDLSNGNALLAEYTGNMLPLPVTFPTNRLRITFISDNYLHTDGFTFHWDAYIPSNIEDYHQSFSSLQPNPANNFVTVNTSGCSEKLHITIYDISGKAILNAPAQEDGNTKLDVSTLQNGTYIVRIQGNSYCDTQKLIIAR